MSFKEQDYGTSEQDRGFKTASANWNKKIGAGSGDKHPGDGWEDYDAIYNG